MTDYTNESPFDPKWEMTPEQIAEVFSLDKNKKYKTMSIDEVDGGIKGQAVPELSAENNMVPMDTGIPRYKIQKLLLTQNYLASLTSIQAILNKLYDDRDNSSISKSNEISEISSAEIDQAFVDNSLKRYSCKCYFIIQVSIRVYIWCRHCSSQRHIYGTR